MIIDPEDEVRVEGRNWRMHKGYWIVSHYHAGQNRPVSLHHFLIGMPINRSLEVDHINRNPADNRKSNLRFVTHRENMGNLSMHKTNKSGHTGVMAVTVRTVKRGKEYVYQYWHACARRNDRHVGLGYHKTKEAAVAARMAYAKS